VLERLDAQVRDRRSASLNAPNVIAAIADSACRDGQ
jgi:hypothetical protein